MCECSHDHDSTTHPEEYAALGDMTRNPGREPLQLDHVENDGLSPLDGPGESYSVRLVVSSGVAGD